MLQTQIVLTSEERAYLESLVQQHGLFGAGKKLKLARGSIAGLLTGTAHRGTFAQFRETIRAETDPTDERVAILKAMGLDPRATLEDLQAEIARLRATATGGEQ